MALGFINPIFGPVVRNTTDAVASRIVAPVRGKIESAARRVTGPFTNNSKLGPIIGAVFGSMEGDRAQPFEGSAIPQELGPLADARGRPDPAWAHNFEAAFASNELWMVDGAFIEDVDLPFYQFDRLSHYRGGKNYYTPGDFDLSQFTLRLYENSYLSTTQFLHAWKGKIRNPDNTVNMPSEYKRNLIVAIKGESMRGAPRGPREIIGTATLKGCWPITPSPISLQSASADRILISCEFSADDIDFEFQYQGL